MKERLKPRRRILNEFSLRSASPLFLPTYIHRTPFWRNFVM